MNTEIGNAISRLSQDFRENILELQGLLEDDFDPNGMDTNRWWTPLQFAMIQNNIHEDYKLEVIALLLFYGAGPLRTNVDGQNAFDTARSYGTPLIMQLLLQGVEYVQLAGQNTREH